MYSIKVTLVGDPFVGKSSISRSLTNKIIKKEYNMTIGVDFNSRDLIVSQKDMSKIPIRIHFWDISGQKKFKGIAKEYFKNSAICFLIFDVSDSKSFKNITIWKNEVENINKNTHFVLIGNKLDSKRIITEEEAKILANSLNIDYYEFSSIIENIGINKNKLLNQIFSKFFKILLTYDNPIETNTGILKNPSYKNKNKDFDCDINISEYLCCYTQ